MWIAFLNDNFRNLTYDLFRSTLSSKRLSRKCRKAQALEQKGTLTVFVGHGDLLVQSQDDECICSNNHNQCKELGKIDQTPFEIKGILHAAATDTLAAADALEDFWDGSHGETVNIDDALWSWVMTLVIVNFNKAFFNWFFFLLNGLLWNSNLSPLVFFYIKFFS